MEDQCNHQSNDSQHDCHASMDMDMGNMPAQHPYLPLCAVIIISSILGVIQAHTMHHLTFHMWMNIAMGYYLVLMATMKFFDLRMFAGNYVKYDLISKVIPGYAYIYPTIELALGAFFINSIEPYLSNIVMAVAMTSSLIGILIVLKKGDVKPCSCMGPALSVPLGIVSVIECASMVAMALMNLLGSGH